MKLLSLAFATVFACLPLTCSAFAAQPGHWDTRAYIEFDQTNVVGTNQVLILGDSITEMLWWNEFGNHLVLNAGEGGAGIDQALINASNIAPLAIPHISMVMIGINDCGTPTPTTDYAAWGAKYAQLLASLKSYSTRVVAVSILPVEPGKSLSPSFSTACQMSLNNQIVAKASAAGVTLLNANYTFGDPSTGYSTMLAGNSIDGVHLNKAGQTKMYNMYLASVLSVW